MVIIENDHLSNADMGRLLEGFVSFLPFYDSRSKVEARLDIVYDADRIFVCSYSLSLLVSTPCMFVETLNN